MSKHLLAVSLFVLLGAGCAVTDAPPAADVTAEVDGSVEQTMPAPGEALVDEMIVEGEGEADVDVEVTSGDDLIGGDAEVSVDAGEEAEANVVSFAIGGESFAFAPEMMTVKKGDTVRITFTNNEGFHDFVIDEFDVQSNKLSEGTSETVEFVADQVGTFEFYCSVGSHRQMGMAGTLVVTE